MRKFKTIHVLSLNKSADQAACALREYGSITTVEEARSFIALAADKTVLTQPGPQPDVFRATRYEFSVANNHCISEKLGNERAQSETSWLHQS
jgi:hypothetical protein